MPAGSEVEAVLPGCLPLQLDRLAGNEFLVLAYLGTVYRADERWVDG